ncbi:MAG: hypothetical protein Tsb0019_30890 [Roseibium sp.]
MTGSVKCQASQPPSPLPQRPASPAFSPKRFKALIAKDTNLAAFLKTPHHQYRLELAKPEFPESGHARRSGNERIPGRAVLAGDDLATATANKKGAPDGAHLQRR